jgi:hypothetical protein
MSVMPTIGGDEGPQNSDARRASRLTYLRRLEDGLSNATWLFGGSLALAIGCALVVFNDHQRYLMVRVPLSVPWAIGWASPLAAMLVLVGYMTRIACLVDRRVMLAYPAAAVLYLLSPLGVGLLALFALRIRVRHRLQTIIKMVAYHDAEP